MNIAQKIPVKTHLKSVPKLLIFKKIHWFSDRKLKRASLSLTNNLMSIPAASIARKKRNIASRDRSSLHLEPDPLPPILS